MADVGGASRRPSRRGSQRAQTSQHSATRKSKSKTTTSRNRRQSTPRTRNVIKAQNCVSSLPADLWTLLLPFLTWRGTDTMLCVCSEWRNVVNEAKKLHPEWHSTVLGPSANGSESLELLRANHLKWADTRFAPDLALLSAASGDSTPWQSGGYWEEAIAAIEEEKLLPSKCRIVGVFTMNAVLGDSEEVEERDTSSSAVTLSITLAHLPETKVEMAEFDRKDLRRYHRGAELENPFEEVEVGDTPSFWLFGVNDQSASQLVPAIQEWHPGAAVVGAVSPLVDRCVPLATYRGGDAAPVGRQERQRRKNKQHLPQPPSRRRPRPRGQVAFPSTMLLRLHGKIGLRTFSSSGYHPVTPVIRCERASVAVEITQVVTYDLVSMLNREASAEAPQYRIMDLLEPVERLAIEQEGRGLNIFSCRESAPLEHLVERCGTSQLKLPAPTSALIDRLEFVFWLQGGLMSLPGLCWQQGAYGVLASHQPTRAPHALTEALQSTQADIVASNERAFGAFLVAGALNEVEDAVHATAVSKLCADMFQGLHFGGCIVSSSVGPVAFPGGLQVPAVTSIVQVQTHTTCGAILYTKV
ncbi:hypothetical protein PRNP1_007560 [Phytophthora ramorum]